MLSISISISIVVKAFKLEIKVNRVQFSSLFDSLELSFATCVDNSCSI